MSVVTVGVAQPASSEETTANAPRVRAIAGTATRPAVALVLGLAVLVLVHSGWVADSSATLVEMGFDPDRARLIASLVAGALIVAVATFASGQRVAPILVGSASIAALFGRVFAQETQDAVAASAGGSFDPAGWWLTVAALAAMTVVVTWASTTLALSLRRAATAGLATIAASVRARRPQAGVLRTGVGFVAVIGIVALAPVVGDMFNFSPDARMHQGGPPAVALFGDGTGPATVPGAAGAGATASGAAAGGPASGRHASGPSGPSGAAAPGTSGSGAVTAPPAQGIGHDPTAGTTTGPLPGSSVSHGAISTDRPWLAWQPTGAGSVSTTQFPAPWVGGTIDTMTVSIYLPPGYAASGRSYPVVYEVPWSLSYWDGGVQLPALLDGLIDGGQIPPVIVMFVSGHGGPYPDSECADSADGRERFETFLTSTLVPWTDAHLRTIPQPGARTVFGFSAGGFCSTNLLLRHPDLFRQAIAISGYYVAGIRSGQTINAWRPFGNDPALLAANSPMQTSAQVAATTRSNLFIALSGDPAEPFYGPQMREFGAALSTAGIPFAWLSTPLGHRWSAVREELPIALEAVAARQASAGVFG